MGDDVVEHLTAVDILKQHVPVVVCTDDISHPTDVRVVEKRDNGGFAGSSDLLGLVCALLFSPALVAIVGRAARDDFAGNLWEECQQTMSHIR
jgi:GT2 family glycosyltransferase